MPVFLLHIVHAAKEYGNACLVINDCIYERSVEVDDNGICCGSYCHALVDFYCSDRCRSGTLTVNFDMGFVDNFINPYFGI